MSLLQPDTVPQKPGMTVPGLVGVGIGVVIWMASHHVARVLWHATVFFMGLTLGTEAKGKGGSLAVTFGVVPLAASWRFGVQSHIVSWTLAFFLGMNWAAHCELTDRLDWEMSRGRDLRNVLNEIRTSRMETGVRQSDAGSAKPRVVSCTEVS